MVRFESVLLVATALLLGTASASLQEKPASHGLIHRRHHARNVSLNQPALEEKKSSGSKRCKNRKSSTTSSSVAKPTATLKVPANVANDPKDEPASTTPVAAAPQPTSKVAAPAPPKPKPTTKQAETPAPQPTQSSGTGSSGSNSGISWMNGVQSGQGTYYNIEGGYTACGTEPSDSDLIAAVSWRLFDNYPGYAGTNPNNNPVCGKKIKATRGGKSIEVTIQDRCTGCAVTDIDFTPAGFNQLADAALGRVEITWEWI